VPTRLLRRSSSELALGDDDAGTPVMTRTDWVLAGSGVSLGIAAMAVDHLLGDDPGLEDPAAFLVSTAVILVLTAISFGLVVRRRSGGGRSGLIVAGLAVAALPLIWVGVPFAVAPAAVALGLKSDSRAGTAAVVIGVTVLLLAAGVYVYDAITKLS
jgi:hypothetical protein